MDAPSPTDLVAELHRRQAAMYAGGPVGPVEEMLSEDITWHVPGNSPIAGDHRGVAAVLDYFRRRRALAQESMKMTPGATIEEGDTVAQFVEGSAVLGGEPVTWRTVGVYRADLDAGRIREAWLLPLDGELFDRIWSRD